MKVVFNKKKEILYLSRANVPYQFKKQSKIIHKHLSIISFLPNALQKFSESNQSLLEKIEDVELLRSLDIGLKLKTITLKGDSFSVDIYDDYEKVKSKMIKDKFYKIYK